MKRSNKIQPLPFYFLRHGQTNWNVEHRAMGITDIPLNQKGIDQAYQSRGLLVHKGISTICYSPLLRAKMTAEIYNEVLDCAMIPIEELKEFNLGSYAGQIIGPWFDEWRNGDTLPGGESYVDFQKRCVSGINKALNRPGLTLVIAHGGVFWSIEHALEVSLGQDLMNCVPVYIDPNKDGNMNWNYSILTETSNGS